MATTPEGKFKTDFRKKLKKLGALTVLQYKQDATTVKGFPDSLAIFEGVVIFIEFKASKRAKYQPGQREWTKRLNDNCHYAYIVYPENADEILKEIKEIVG